VSDTLFAVTADDVSVTTDDWYTPRWVFQAAALTFDMDVSAPILPSARTVPARRYLTIVEDGLATPWEGVIWCNPPYSKATPWVDKWAAHDQGMILLPAVPEVRWLGRLLSAADSMTLISCDFIRPGGGVARLRWPQILAARGGECSEALARVAAADKYAEGGYVGTAA
jgi:hypothetical protein